MVLTTPSDDVLSLFFSSMTKDWASITNNAVAGASVGLEPVEEARGTEAADATLLLPVAAANLGDDEVPKKHKSSKAKKADSSEKTDAQRMAAAVAEAEAARQEAEKARQREKARLEEVKKREQEAAEAELARQRAEEKRRADEQKRAEEARQRLEEQKKAEEARQRAKAAAELEARRLAALRVCSG